LPLFGDSALYAHAPRRRTLPLIVAFMATALFMPAAPSRATGGIDNLTIIFTTPEADPLDISYTDPGSGGTLSGTIDTTTGSTPYSVSSADDSEENVIPSATDITELTMDVTSSSVGDLSLNDDDADSEPDGDIVTGLTGFFLGRHDAANTFTDSAGTVFTPDISSFPPGTQTITFDGTPAPELSSGVSFGILLACLALATGAGRLRSRSKTPAA